MDLPLLPIKVFFLASETCGNVILSRRRRICFAPVSHQKKQILPLARSG